MMLSKHKLHSMIDEQVENTLNEWFGQSKTVQNIGNILSPGFGDKINHFANGDYNSVNGAHKLTNDDYNKIRNGNGFKEYCQKHNFNPQQASNEQIAQYYYGEVFGGSQQ